jgi:hypothetical protein
MAWVLEELLMRVSLFSGVPCCFISIRRMVPQVVLYVAAPGLRIEI